MNTPHIPEDIDLMKALFDKLDAEHKLRQQAKSSLSNPILNKVRDHLAEGKGYTLEAMAYEGMFSARDVLNYGYSVEAVYGFPGTREHATQALQVFLRILRIERSIEEKS